MLDVLACLGEIMMNNQTGIRWGAKLATWHLENMLHPTQSIPSAGTVPLEIPEVKWFTQEYKSAMQ